LVTFNMKDFAPAAREFGLRIMSPAQFVRRMRT
jgi:hypothetical protein